VKIAIIFRVSVLHTQTDNEIGSNGGLLVAMGKGKELRTPDWKSDFLMIDSMSKDGVPETGAFTIVGDLFQTDRRTITSLWWKTINAKHAQLLNNHNNVQEELPPTGLMEIYSRASKQMGMRRELRGGVSTDPRECQCGLMTMLTRTSIDSCSSTKWFQLLWKCGLISTGLE
jgi:hypothetical protein